MKNLLDERALQTSPVVANSLMNRERVFTGGNSYRKELSFDLHEYLNARLPVQEKTGWLDLCCGSGKALLEAARLFARQNPSSKIEIVGVDLAGMFAPRNADLDFLRLIESPFENYKPDREFDLITCVHGLHYIGDKLSFIAKAARWLKADGMFLANLDLANLKFTDGKPAKKTFAAALRKRAIEYDSRKRLLVCRGKKEINFKFTYAGADDRAGANYTKQSVVDSFYENIF